MAEHKDKNVWDKQHGGSHYQKYVIQPSKPWDGGIDTAYSFNIDRNNFDL